MQQLTVAVSPKAIQGFLAEIVGALITGAFTAPDQPNVTTDLSLPTSPCTTYIDSISLFGGVVSNVAATLQGPVRQQPKGVFGVSVSASFSVTYQTWHEVGSQTCPTFGGGSGPGLPPTTTPYDVSLPGFSFTISSVVLSFDVQISGAGAAWTVTVSNPQTSDATVSAINIPAGSNLNGSTIFPCMSSRINEQIRGVIEDFNYAASLQSELQGFLTTIPDSGKLANGIVYQFAPQIVTFPGDNGIVAGVTGQVVWNGTAFPGPPPADIPLPAVMPALDFVANVGIFEFDALLWAFYEVGALQLTVTAGMIPESQYLNTAFYQQKFPALYEFAPDAPMEVQVGAAQRPMVNTAALYMVTPPVLARLAQQLPPTVLTALETIKNAPFADPGSFNNALSEAIGSTNAQTYGTAIVTASTGLGLYVQSTWNLTVNVLKNGARVEAFVIQVVRTDVLTGFALEAQGAVQTLTFQFNERSSTTSCISSNIAGLNSDILEVIWFLVDPEVDEAIQAVGTTGVPLPFIKGFVFDDATISVQSGYVTVASDIGSP